MHLDTKTKKVHIVIQSYICRISAKQFLQPQEKVTLNNVINFTTYKVL